MQKQEDKKVRLFIKIKYQKRIRMNKNKYKSNFF